MIFYEIRNITESNDKHLGYYQNIDNAVEHIVSKAMKIDHKFYRCTTDIIDAVLGGDKTIRYTTLEEVEDFVRDNIFGENAASRCGVRCLGGYRYIIIHETVD